MAELFDIQRAAENLILWPPIAEATDTYLRRLDSHAEGYELIWRLIHVWEATAATLSTAAVARLRGLPDAAPVYLRCREFLYGRTWNSLSGSFDRFQGALDGGATQRLDILAEISNAEIPASRFLQSLRNFCITEGIDLRPLVTSWGRICDVPNEAIDSDKHAVRDAFRHVNSFRNRFAHVPFPYDELEELADALAHVTEQLFSIEPQPWQNFPDERLESPLNGCYCFGARRLRGTIVERTKEEIDGLHFCFPARSLKEVELQEKWDATPFAFVDSMMRPSILTRLRSQANGVWEFTRFGAERNSITTKQSPQWLSMLPEPVASDYPASAVDQKEEELAIAAVPEPPGALPDSTAEKSTDFEKALRSIANEDYEPAISFFQRLTAENPSYHIGWLRLGHAQRELGMRRYTQEPSAAADLFTDSIEALTKAAEHSHSERVAQALYERSKSHYHLGRLLDNGPEKFAALGDARRAYQIHSDTKYVSWIRFLEQHILGQSQKQRVSKTTSADLNSTPSII